MKTSKTIILLYPFFFGAMGYLALRGGWIPLGYGLFVFSILYAIINIGQGQWKEE